MSDDWFDDKPPAQAAPLALVPRARPTPSERNVRIHELVRLRHERQEDVAARHGLTQQRVSAICSQVESWHKWQRASPDYEAIAAEQQRQQLLECRAREETLLVLALRRAVAQRNTLVSVKRVTTPEGIQETRTERPIPANPAWLKMVRASSQSIARMNAELGVQAQTSALADEIERLWRELLAGELSSPVPDDEDMETQARQDSIAAQAGTGIGESLLNAVEPIEGDTCCTTGNVKRT